jgi:hypothetical protein
LVNSRTIEGRAGIVLPRRIQITTSRSTTAQAAGITHSLRPLAALVLETPTRVVSERHAQASPSGWRVRHAARPSGVAGVAGVADGVAGAADVDGVAACGSTGGVGRTGGAVAAGGVDGVGGVVCAKATEVAHARRIAAAGPVKVFISTLRLRHGHAVTARAYTRHPHSFHFTLEVCSARAFLNRRS